MSKGATEPAALRDDELAAQQAATLPAREVMTLIDPNALGSGMLADPTQGTGTGPTGGASDPTAGAATGATQAASDGPHLAGGYMPNPSQIAGQGYSPTASSTATS